MPAPTYIEGEQLVQLLRGEDSTETCVLDVRDEDFQGGHIRGCLNIWSEEFYDDENVDAVIQKHGLLRYRQVVVTCFMSQQRGPFCAKRLASRLDALATQDVPKVQVLYGGMRKFKRDYAGDPDLFDNLVL
ncbi:Rhodanese-like protein [Coccomyxa subellipsoidea C-169]|uniref:Rhodanese-like protein n=1 Tax=Coccomyxa subellipsoidea (strain C-169) TaxID=574566 RepID=I0YWV3_COCSC|nr:Rhodanese-like protein [Coccomyxa subellipsoidea C-169]EIE22872.1 Rhodanese-like protein [Coccomyxa subellipsoidea C-169]|eukprot:XP_005647416.1 Rhodanese-like protein [Coccomyxa subellipsoidea C-169]